MRQRSCLVVVWLPGLAVECRGRLFLMIRISGFSSNAQFPLDIALYWQWNLKVDSPWLSILLQIMQKTCLQYRLTVVPLGALLQYCNHPLGSSFSSSIVMAVSCNRSQSAYRCEFPLLFLLFFSPVVVLVDGMKIYFQRCVCSLREEFSIKCTSNTFYNKI